MLDQTFANINITSKVIKIEVEGIVMRDNNKYKS